MSKTQPLVGDPIEDGRLNDWIPIGTRMLIRLIIRDAKQDIRPIRSKTRRKSAKKNDY
jgi:hypothetical protein